MERQELIDKVYALKTEKQSFLNDTFFWVKLAREAVDKLPDTRFRFKVPKAGTDDETRTVSRNNGQEIKARIINRDIYNSAFVSMVAVEEDYLSKIMTLLLQYDNRRIKCTIAGINFSKDVQIVDLIDKDREIIIRDIINQRVESVFYAGPQKQLEYFDKALGLKLNKEVWGKWIEIKARRDLWVHNAGIVNQIYMDKSGEYGLCGLGEEAVIGEQYFAGSVVLLKKMIGRIYLDIKRL